MSFGGLYCGTTANNVVSAKKKSQVVGQDGIKGKGGRGACEVAILLEDDGLVWQSRAAAVAF